MQTNHSRVRIEHTNDGRGRFPHESRDEESFGELLKRLSADIGTLVSQETALAKAELRESAQAAAKATAKSMIGITIANAGFIALTAFLVLLLGDALESYWIAALVVGVANIVVGTLLARKAMKSLSGSELRPTETIESLRESKEWAGREAKELKQDITSGHSTAAMRR